MPTSFDAFLEQLPVVTSPRPQLTPIAERWVSYIEEANPGFVAPTLSQRIAIVAGHTAVVVVSAPGAVGKTTLAREIAYRTKAPLFDLAQRTVGSDTFLGLLGNAFGIKGISGLVERLESGEFLLLFDALDETRIGSREKNFTDFLDDIVIHTTMQSARPRLLLFARAETAALINEWLFHAGVGYADYEIELFDKATSAALVERRLDLLCTLYHVAPFHRRGIFPSVRNTLFELVRNAAAAGTTRQSGDEFLGYAPVLVGLAEYLFEQRDENYQRIRNELEGYRELKLPPSELLRRIIEGILRREQKEKFAPQLRQALKETLDPKVVEGAFNPDEQCLHLLYRRFLGARSAPAPESIPGRSRDAYEGLVTSQLEDHPFLREGAFAHTAFRDYVYAWLLTRRDDRSELRSTARQRLIEENYLPSALLGRFILALAATGVGPRVRSADLGFLYESLLAGARDPDKVRLTLRTAGGGGEITGLLIDSASKEHHAFQLTGPQHRVWIWRRIMHADVRIDSGIELGSAQRDFTIGPDVGIECDTFVCSAANLWVNAPTDDDFIVVEARTNVGSSQPRIGGKRDRLFVRWDPLQYPWIDRRLPEMTTDERSPAVMDAFRHLRRILMWFRAKGYDDIARHADFVNKVAPGGTHAAQQVLEFCLERGLIRQAGPLYDLDLNRFANLGVHWDQMRKGEMNPKVRRLLAEFLTSKAS